MVKWKNVKKGFNKNKKPIAVIAVVLLGIVVWGAVTGWQFFRLAGGPAETVYTDITVNTVDKNDTLIGATLDISYCNVSEMTSDEIDALQYTNFTSLWVVDTNTTSGWVFTPEADCLYICMAYGAGLQTNFKQLTVGIMNIQMWTVPESVNILAYDSVGSITVANSVVRDWNVEVWNVFDSILNETVGYNSICDFRLSDYQHWGTVNTYPYLNVTFNVATDATDVECAFSLGNTVSGFGVIVPLGSISGHNVIPVKYGTRMATVKPVTIALYFGNSTTKTLLDSQ
jgi:hypothetical protein